MTIWQDVENYLATLFSLIDHTHEGGEGVTDHGALTGLADDDHSQYHNDARGDARYAPIAEGVTNGDSHDHNGGDGGDLTELIQDIIGAMVSGNTESGILVSYDDSTGKLNFVTITAAVSVSYSGSAGISATDVEGALDELDTEKTATTHDHTGGAGAAIPAGGVSAKAPLLLGGHGVGGTVPAGTSYYICPTISGLDTAGRAWPLPVATVLKKLYVRLAGAQPGTGTLVCEIFAGASGTTATGVKVTIAAGAAAGTYSDLTNTYNAAAGDLVNVKITNNASGASAAIGGVAFEADAALV